MRTYAVRLGLSLMVMISVWTHGLPAQEPIGSPHVLTSELIGVPPPGWQLFVVPAIAYDIDHHDPLPAPFEDVPRPGTARHRLMQLMNQQGYGCSANGGWGCGNACYDLRFFFGSCRDFFNERCEPCQQKNGAKRW